jgi:hypothetical protein
MHPSPEFEAMWIGMSAADIEQVLGIDINFVAGDYIVGGITYKGAWYTSTKDGHDLRCYFDEQYRLQLYIVF